MKQEDRAAFGRMLTLVAEQYNRQVSPDLIQLYFDGLSHISIDDIRAALNKHLRNTEVGQFMPKVADVIRACDGGAETAALRALRQVQEAFRNPGAYGSVRFADTCINATINDMGGWPALCAKDSDEWQKFGSREFMRRYTAYKERGDFNAPGYLPGYFELVNVASGFKADEPVLIGAEQKQITKSQPGEDDE